MRKVATLSAIFFLYGIVLTGCKKKDQDFGLNVQPQGDQLNVDIIDTTELITYSTESDSIKTDELDGPNMVGSYVDPYFGKLETSIISQIRLESAIDFTEFSGSVDSLVVDSVVMYIALDGYFGDLDPQTFEVYQIAEDIFEDSTYYSNTPMTTQGNNLVSGSGTLTPNPLNVGYVGNELTNMPILRLPLSINDVGWKIINESGNTTLDGNDGTGEFVEWYKGLMITTNNPSQAVNEGGIMYADMINEFSKVTIYYRDTSGTATEHDTLDFDLNFNGNCARFHQTNFDYTGSYVGAEIADSTLGQDVFFLQALGGVKGNIAIPNLENFIDSGKVVVNKAELILPFQYYALDNYFPPAQLYLTAVLDSTDSFLPDITESGSGGTPDFTTNTYTFNITRYVNGIFSGEYENDGLTLIASGSGITANRVVFNGQQSSNKDKPRLILTYTKY